MSDIEKDAITWVKIIAVTELVLLLGIVFTGYITPNDFLFKRLVISFVIILALCIFAIAFLIVLVIRLSNMEDNKPSQKPRRP